MNQTDDLQKTISFYKQGGAPSLQQMAADLVKDLQIGAGPNPAGTATGLQAYNLFPVAITLFPVLTPLRNLLPRYQGRGKQSEFKAVLGIGAGPAGDPLANFFGTEGQSGAKVELIIEDILAVYKSGKQATGVSFEQQWAGQGFVDSKATAVVNLLRQFMINEERAILYGQNSSAAASQFAGGAVGTQGSFTAGNLSVGGTGGTIPTGSTFVRITAVTGMGESLPSLEATLAITLGQNLTITMPAKTTIPILYYNVYASTTTNTEKLQSSTSMFTVASANTPSTIGVNYAAGNSVILSSITASGVLYSSVAADTTASSKAYNGLLAMLFGATASGASSQTGGSPPATGLGFYGPTILSAAASLAMTGAGTNSLEQLLAQMWLNAYADPNWFLANQLEARNITKGTLGAGTPYFVVVNPSEQNNATANFRVSRFTNPVTGSEVEVKVHPNLTQGTLIAGSDRLPEWYVPPGDIPSPMAMDMLQDYTEVDYAPVYSTTSGGDTWVIEIVNMGTFKLFIPAIFGVMHGIAQS